MGMSYQHIEVRQVKYLNNLVEQDHRFIKKITQPMRGFKAFGASNSLSQLCHLFLDAKT
jgi:putative transposase